MCEPRKMERLSATQSYLPFICHYLPFPFWVTSETRVSNAFSDCLLTFFLVNEVFLYTQPTLLYYLIFNTNFLIVFTRSPRETYGK